VIHPALYDVRAHGADEPCEPDERGRRVHDAGHAHTMDRDPERLEIGAHAPARHQRYHDRLEAAAVHRAEDAAELGLGPAPLQPGDDVEHSAGPAGGGRHEPSAAVSSRSPRCHCRR
jgi:hypothetical protein